MITADKAALWTDGRYFLQAEKQLDENWILMRDGEQSLLETLKLDITRNTQLHNTHMKDTCNVTRNNLSASLTLNSPNRCITCFSVSKQV